jgi:hypothetical protein
MALKEKTSRNYDLGNNVGDFFSIPLEVPNIDIKISDDIRKRIYALDVDAEEKANILNKISIYNTITNIKEKNRLKKEIESFLEENE